MSKPVKIQNWQDFTDHVLERLNNGRWLFRGMASSTFELIPKVGRRRSLLISEQEMVKEFKRHLPEHLVVSGLSEWDVLAMAQHHGLPTRLLDWSRSPLVGLFFAVDDPPADHREDDAVLFVFDCEEYLSRETEIGPFDLREPTVFRPRLVTSRITAQKGVFTVSAEPDHPFQPPNNTLQQFVISRSCCADFKKRLFVMGIDRSVLFPELDGLCDHLEWLADNCLQNNEVTFRDGYSINHSFSSES